MTLGITRGYKHAYTSFFVLLSSISAFVVPAAILVLSGRPDDVALALTVMVFLVMAPGLSVPVLKLMYIGGNLRQITAGNDRIDEILAEEPITVSDKPESPTDHTVAFDDVSFSYGRAGVETRVERALGGLVSGAAG